MELISAGNKKYDLSKWKNFKEYAENPANFSEHIVVQINNGMYNQLMPKEPNLTIVDMGANIGLTSLYFNDVAKIVISVEPTPAHYMAICSMIGVFNCENIVPVNAAVSPTTKFNNFMIENGNTTMNRISQSISNLQVPCFSPADLFARYNLNCVDFCKIDIEGEEINIAENLVPLQIKKIFIECHGGDSVTKSIQKILQRGYKVERISHDGLVAEK